MTFASDPICAVVAAQSARAMVRELRSAASVASTIELRLDWLANRTEIERLLRALPGALSKIRARGRHAPRNLCVIATIRRRDAGGRYRGSRREQWKFLLAAAAAGCVWCDIELASASRLSAAQLGDLRAAGARMLVSFHDFRRTPRDLRGIVARLDRCHGDAIKIATQCKDLSDCARVLATTRGRGDVVAIPMGDAGLPGRILALRAGSALAYASLNESTAPGQLSVHQMRRVYRTEQLDRRTRIFAVVGNPVAHSLSPAIHNAGYESLRKNAIFIPICAENICDFARSVASLGISGAAVTIPHKQTIIRHLAKCDSLAARIGAVNTLVTNKRGKLQGYNTDYVGAVRTIEAHLRLKGSSILILGAGGAARAAAFALTDAGASVTICARRSPQARELARATGAATISRDELKHRAFDLIINATPVGLSKRDHSPLNPTELNCKLAMDMIYNPLDTPFLKMARRRGIKTLSGLDMFIEQAAAQWKIWWGTPAPIAVMRRAAMRALRVAPPGKIGQDASHRPVRSH